ncbi:hypothetical protein EZZ79_11610 [Pseudomonas syringae]|nr:hypothetical protein EZZ79_11610 [Pseudomonas syringae]
MKKVPDTAFVGLSNMSPAARSAAMRGGMSGWGQHGSSDKHIRYMEPMPSTSRRRCSCGCKRRATHLGMANGVGLCSGCEMKIRRWVKEGSA